MNAAVMAALMASVFVLGMTWGYILVLTFSGNLIKPGVEDPTDFVKCGDIAVNFAGEPMICTRLRAHELPHQDEAGNKWMPIPTGWGAHRWI